MEATNTLESGKSVKRWLLIAVRVVVSTILLAWVLSRANLREVLAAAAGAQLPLLLFAYALNFVGVLITAVRWRGLLEAHGVNAPMGFLVRSVLVGVFFNNFLPSTVGGDAMRAYDLYRLAQRSAPMTSVVVDRLLGLIVLTLFALVSLPFASQLTSRTPGLSLLVVGGGAGLLIVAWSIFSAGSFGILLRMLSKLPAGLSAPAGRLFGGFGAYRGQTAALVRGFGWSFLLQSNVILYYVVIARAFGYDIPVIDFFLMVPLVLYVMMVPITVNGIGLRENVFALFFAAYGIGNSGAVAFAWLAYFGGLLYGILGAAVYALRRVDPALEPVTPPVGPGVDG